MCGDVWAGVVSACSEVWEILWVALQFFQEVGHAEHKVEAVGA